MKNTNKLLIIFACSLFMGCDDRLDLIPQQDVAEEIALNTDANVKAVLNGAYDAMSSGNLYGGEIINYSELLAAGNEISWVGTFNQPREIYGKNIITTNSYVRDTWLDAYNTINIANNILSALEVVNEEDQDRVEGEARFIRASMYFELVKLYAKPYSDGDAATNLGVPLITTPTRGINGSTNVGRSTVEEVYQLVIDDLALAESLLPTSNDVFATKSAAAAQLSRVYLQTEDFEEARDAANRVIETYGEQELTHTYAEAFNNTENSSETIFAIQVSAQDGANDMHLFWSIPAYGARDGDVEIQDNHTDLYEVGDERLDLFYMGAGARRSGKWQLQYRNLNIIRLAEMYLTRAEANQQLTESVGDTPLNDLNLIRERAGLDPLASVDMEAILLERKLELAHEGQAIHDIKRLRQSIEGYAYDADKLVLPIPQREMDSNPALKGQQNSGYGN